ncbi:MAG: hypothetical protein V2A73_01225 [Pseudomonadota bacterium]
MKRFLVLLSIVVALPNSALGYGDKAHQTISKEALLWMMRSSDPSLRLAAVTIIAAGEGQRASPTGDEHWPLADESVAVDYYRDVMLINDSKSAKYTGKYLYDIGGHAFTAFNHFLLYGQSADGYSFDKKRWMQQHDNIPGYSLAKDSSMLNGSYLGIPTSFVRAVTTQQLQELCEETLDNKIADFAKFGTAFLTLGVFGIEAAGAVWIWNERYDGDPLTNRVTNALGEYGASFCPSMKGVWIDSPTAASEAMIVLGSTSDRLISEEYRTHSAITKNDVHRISAFDIRWHPIDNLAAYGVAGFLDPTNLKYAANRKDGYVLLAEVRPGVLPSLGRLIHAMADVAVPGHVSGRLFGPEHILFEENALDQFEQFAGYSERKDPKTGTTIPEYHTSKKGKELFNLSWLIDTDMAENQIAGLMPDLPTRGIESLVEKAAERTFIANVDYKLDVDPTGESGTAGEDPEQFVREYNTRALVNVVMGTTRAIQLYYEQNVRYDWNEILSHVSWTSDDITLVETAFNVGKGGRMPWLPGHPVERAKETPRTGRPDPVYPGEEGTLCSPEEEGSPWCIGKHRVGYRVDPPPLDNRVWERYSTNAQFYYEIKIQPDNCYVASHDWGINPPFVSPSVLTGKCTLPKENKGRPDDSIHIVGGDFHFRGNLTETAGTEVLLPPGALVQGVAKWCTGPDILNTKEVRYQQKEDGTFDISIDPRVHCEVSSCELVGFDECNDAERYIFEQQKGVPHADLLRQIARPQYHHPAPQPRLPLPGQNGVYPIDSLAQYYRTYPSSLSVALASARGRQVTVLDPSPWGRVSFIWTDPSNRQVTTTVLRNGNIVTSVSSASTP